MTDVQYRFEAMGQRHARTTFACGVDALDRYFHQQAGQDHRRGVAVPYVLVNSASGDIIGYYTLSTFSIVPASLPDALARKLPHYDAIPAILIGRLAVDQRYRGAGFGGLLLIDALRRSLAVSREIGATSVVVDAKDGSARSFYEHHGFTSLVDHGDRLFLPMSTIAKLDLTV